MGNSQPSYFSPEIFVPSPKNNFKGLINTLGDNNCFLNVVIQALWHLDSFRKQFEGSKEKHQHSPPCVFCALQNLFINYTYSDERMIPPTDLRRALSVQFAAESRFKLGEMYDATETLMAVLGYLHRVLVGSEGGKEDEPCEPMCLVHQVFSMNFCDRTECQCGATSEPSLSSTFIYPIYVVELQRTFADAKRPDIRFDELMSILNDCELKKCPDFDVTECKRKNRNQRFLQNVPKVFTIDLVWASPTPAVEDIRETLTIISSGGLDLATVFYGLERETTYVFRGMIVYYGRHYAAFFHCRSRDEWHIFDDEKIKVVGKTWDDVIANCCRAHWQPHILFYERREGPVPMSPIIPAAMTVGGGVAAAATAASPTDIVAAATMMGSGGASPGSVASALRLSGLATHSTPDCSLPGLSASSFTSNSVSAALSCAFPTPGSSPSMRRSRSDYGMAITTNNGHTTTAAGGPMGNSCSPAQHYTPTAPINIATGSSVAMGASLPHLMSSSSAHHQRSLAAPVSKDDLQRERSRLVRDAEKEVEQTDLISSPGDHEPGLGGALEGVLPPLVASPSADLISPAAAGVVVNRTAGLLGEWHATKRDLHPRAHAERVVEARCDEDALQQEAPEGKGKEGKLVVADATQPQPQQQRRRPPHTAGVMAAGPLDVDGWDGKQDLGLSWAASKQDLVKGSGALTTSTPTPMTVAKSPPGKAGQQQQQQQQVFSCEFVIGQVDMREREFQIKRAFEAFGRRWLLVLERSYRLNEAWWGSDKRGYEGYITVRVHRLDPGTDVLRLAVTFECRAQSRVFACSMPCVAVRGNQAAGDPYFLCPQRQRQYLTGRKELGLSLTMQLLS